MSNKVLLLTNDETDGFGLGDVRKIDGVHYRLTRLADGKNEWTPIIKATKDEIDKYEFGDIKEVGEDSYLFSYNDATKDYEWILEKIDISDAEDSRNNLTWSDLGFDGSYVGDFDINHAKELLAGGYKSQKDAVKYLTFYAKNNVNDAKIVRICDIINKKNEFDPDIWEYANSAFYMIFRAYINKVILAHYARIQSEHINKGQVEDAYSHLWEYVLLNLHDYNPEKGRINTYYSVKILDTELMRFDFRYRANVSVSHPTEMQDIAVARIVRMLEECGEEVTLQNVCARARYDRKLKNCGSAAIESSLERNNFRVMSSIDSEEGQNMMKDRTQETFDNPEHAYMRQEKRGYILKAYNMLSDLQKKILIAKVGIAFDENGTLIDYGTLSKKDMDSLENQDNDGDITVKSKQDQIRSNKMAAAILKIPEGEVEREYNQIQNILRNNIPHSEKNNKFLYDRGPIYTKDDDLILSEFLMDIDDISFEDTEGKFTKVEDFD